MTGYIAILFILVVIYLNCKDVIDVHGPVKGTFYIIVSGTIIIFCTYAIAYGMIYWVLQNFYAVPHGYQLADFWWFL